MATGLDAPWSILPLLSGSILISQRDRGSIVEVTGDGSTRQVGVVPDVQPGGEGGLLGLTALDVPGQSWLYAYFTAATDNRIVRFPLRGSPGSYALGAAESVLTGLNKAGVHNGGRLAFGPDGMLYATVGDAGQRNAAQDIGSRNGKILRMAPDGTVPEGNPFPGSLVWTLGHRNPQGIGWAADGTMYAAEFGQNAWDELNRIVPGGNYGWPVVEGRSDRAEFVNPIYSWRPSAASPSGIAVLGRTVLLAALRGERLWTVFDVYPEGTASAFAVGAYGRLRDAVLAPDGGSVYLLTNNTDGRGSPRAGDDRLLRIGLAPAPGP